MTMEAIWGNSCCDLILSRPVGLADRGQGRRAKRAGFWGGPGTLFKVNYLKTFSKISVSAREARRILGDFGTPLEAET